MANGLALVVWIVTMRVAPGFPLLTEEIIAGDEGCTAMCVAYVNKANAWRESQGVRGRASCVCLIERECSRPGCIGEQLRKDVP